MDDPSRFLTRGRRFALLTGGAFALMLVPCALHVACVAGLLPAASSDALMAVSISGAAVGSARLLHRLCDA
ncbi:MAG: hypothetical protein IT493_02995 [Gammaproteobacteria bacterium]|nr:hypothetical protein [Gammaproteobacteria bacterium]